MYCPECGTKIDEPMNFCPECGTNLIGLMAEMEAEAAANKPQQAPAAPTAQPTVQPSAPSQPAQPAQSNKIETFHADLPAAEPEKPSPQREEPQEDLPEIVLRGFLFTNLTTLSQHLRTTVDALRELLQQFIKAKRSIGISYQLIDAGDYEYKERGLFGGHKHVKLGKSSPWYEYADILLDLNKAEKKAKQPETEYLFIVGGNETVPMPTLPHWQKDNPRFGDSDYDTDLLYAYPYGPEMEEHMWTGRIFTYDALFYIGRLPLVGGEEGAQDLVNYLNRDLENSLGITVETGYVQSDTNWKGVTAKNVSPLLDKLKFATYRQSPPPSDSFAYNFLILSPSITLLTKEARYNTITYFNPNAQYLFFNLHGSNDPEDPCYGGKTFGSQDHYYQSMAPFLIAESKHPNIVFAQPCYGARFIRYSKEQSMVLTALSNKTLIYAGSSRIALGNPDGDYSFDQAMKLPLNCSDITGYVFNDLMMHGCTAGEAFFQARCETYRLGDKSWGEALTIGEFNLYGDPTLFCAVDDGNKSASKASKAALTNEKEGIFISGMETLMQKSADKPLSMLEQLRQQVNKNLMEMSDSIGKHLYEQYGIPKREPFFVQKIKYSNGSEELNFHYEAGGDDEKTKSVYIVNASPNGDIKKVMQSK